MYRVRGIKTALFMIVTAEVRTTAAVIGYRSAACCNHRHHEY